MKIMLKHITVLLSFLLLFSSISGNTSPQQAAAGKPQLNLLQEEAQSAIYGDSITFFKVMHELIQLSEVQENMQKKCEALRLAGVYYYVRGLNPQAHLYYNKALRLAAEHNLPRQTALVWNNSGILFELEGKYDTALRLYQMAYHRLDSLADSITASNPLTNLGNIYYQLGDYDNALEYYGKVYELESKNKSQRGLMMSLNNIGNVNYKRKNYRQALKNYRDAAEIAEKNVFLTDFADALSNIGLIYKEQLEYEKALEYYNLSLETNIKTERSEALIVDYNNIASVYLAQHKLQMALLFLKKAVEINKSIQNPVYESSTLINLGKYYLKKGDNRKALDEFTEAYKIVKNYGLNDQLKDVSFILSELYLETGKHRQAYEMLALAERLEDSIFNEQNTRIIEGLNIRYESVKKNAENENLRKEKELADLRHANGRRFNFILLITLSLFLILSIIMMILFRRFKKANHELRKREKQLTEHAANLQLTEKKYKTVLAQSDDLIFIVKDRKLIYTNDRTERFTGFTKEEVLNENILELIHPEDRPKFTDKYLDMLSRHEGSIAAKFRLIHKLGKIRYVHAKLAWLDTDAETDSGLILGTLKDQSREVEVSMEAGRLGTELHKNKDDGLFLFTALKEELHPLLLKYTSHDQEKAGKCLETLILWFRLRNKIDPGESRIAYLKPTLIHAQHQMKTAASQKEIKTELHCDDETLAYFNPWLLMELLKRLINTALQVSTPGGRINIMASSRPDGFAVMEIIDDGPGLESKEASTIFDPEKQGSKAYNRIEMQLCREIALIQGGELQFRSTMGEGSTFSIILPESPDKNKQL